MFLQTIAIILRLFESDISIKNYTLFCGNQIERVFFMTSWRSLVVVRFISYILSLFLTTYRKEYHWDCIIWSYFAGKYRSTTNINQVRKPHHVANLLIIFFSKFEFFLSRRDDKLMIHRLQVSLPELELNTRNDNFSPLLTCDKLSSFFFYFSDGMLHF